MTNSYPRLARHFSQPPGAIRTARALGNNSFELMLSDRAYELRQQHVKAFRISNCGGKLLRNFTQAFAPLLERPKAHILAAQHEHIERVQYDSCRFAAKALQEVERGLAVLVDCHDFAVDDGIWGEVPGVRSPHKEIGGRNSCGCVTKAGCYVRICGQSHETRRASPRSAIDGLPGAIRRSRKASARMKMLLSPAYQEFKQSLNKAAAINFGRRFLREEL
jgi:hypothetical protein